MRQLHGRWRPSFPNLGGLILALFYGMLVQRALEASGGRCDGAHAAFPSGVPLGWLVALWALVDVARDWFGRNPLSVAVGILALLVSLAETNTLFVNQFCRN